MLVGCIAGSLITPSNRFLITGPKCIAPWLYNAVWLFNPVMYSTYWQQSLDYRSISLPRKHLESRWNSFGQSPKTALATLINHSRLFSGEPGLIVESDMFLCFIIICYHCEMKAPEGWIVAMLGIHSTSKLSRGVRRLIRHLQLLLALQGPPKSLSKSDFISSLHL